MGQDDTAYIEWRAWQLVTEQFQQLGLDINDPKFNPLIRTIEAWAELLVELRLTQDDTTRKNIRMERLALCLNTLSASL